MKQEAKLRDELGAVKDGKNSRCPESDEPAEKDGEHERENAHLENASGEDEELPWGRRGQHGGDQEGEKLLFFKAVAELLVAGTVDAFEEEQLATRAPEQERNEAADGGTERAHEDVGPGVTAIGPVVAGQEEVHRDGDGRGVDERDGTRAPDTPGLEEGQQEKSPVGKQGEEMLQRRGPEIFC